MRECLGVVAADVQHCKMWPEQLPAAHLSGPRSVPDAASSGPTLKAPGSAGGYLLEDESARK
jgi:hypothetical protein